MHDSNITLWTLDAVYWHHNPSQPKEQSPILAHPIDHENGIFPFPATILYHNNNSIVTKYVTHDYNPAFNIHLGMLTTSNVTSNNCDFPWSQLLRYLPITDGSTQSTQMPLLSLLLANTH